VVKPETKEIVSQDPWSNEVIVYEEENLIRRLKFIQGLRKRHFDLAIDLIWDYPLKSALLTYLSGARYRVGYDIAGRGIFFNIRVIPDKREKHIIERTLDVVRTISVDTPNREPEIMVSSQGKNYVNEFLSQHNILPKDLVVGIHPGGHYPTQRWNKEGFAQVGDKIARKYGAKIVIVGSPRETRLVQGVVNLMETEPVSMVGTSLEQLIALIDRCNLFICNNSGPLHIAVALKTPTVSTMGPTIPKRWWPIGDNHIVIRKDLDCSPCNLGYCPRKTHDCMRLITVQEILEAVDLQLKSRKVRKWE
jgi:lipopolysaccharide heptosyltransferase II